LPPHWALLPFLSRPGLRGGGGSSDGAAPGGCPAEALWAAVALARGLEASTAQPPQPWGLTASHLDGLPAAHKLVALLQLLVLDRDEEEDIDAGEENAEKDKRHGGRGESNGGGGAFALATSRGAFGADVSALFDAWASQAVSLASPTQRSPRRGLGAQLAAAAEALTPPSPMDRIEALAAAGAPAATATTAAKAARAASPASPAVPRRAFGVDVGSPLANRCLERTARLLAQRFADAPPPAAHAATAASAAASRVAADTSVESTVRRALHSLLRTDVGAGVRSAVWRSLAQRQVLHLLAEGWRSDDADAAALGGAAAFVEPPDDDPELLRAYAKAVGSLGRRRPAPAAFLWRVAASHLAADATTVLLLPPSAVATTRAKAPAAAGAGTATAGAETATAGAETATAGAETATTGAETATAGAETATAGAGTATAAAAATATAVATALEAAALPSWGRRQRLADLLAAAPAATLADVLALAPSAALLASAGGAAAEGGACARPAAARVSLEAALLAVAAEKPALQPKVNQLLALLVVAGALPK
jgi:hypothetical protein